MTAPKTENDFRAALINVLRGPIYRSERENLWRQLLSTRRRVDDYVRVMGMTLVLDEAKGYAFLRSNIDEDDPDHLPRLIARYTLSYPVSLLLALLRRRLAEFDASSGDARLVVTLEEMVNLMSGFVAGGANEARAVDRIEAHVKRVVELGFLREQAAVPGTYEVRRILEAFVDAQWLAEFDARLAAYAEVAE